MEDINLTPEQYERYIQTVDEFQQLRTLSREEKIKIIDDILKAPFLDLRSDWAFKYVFGGHPDLLKMLLNDFLPEPVESVTVLPNELPHNRPDDKNIILDVLCRLGDGREIIVEMQRKGRSRFVPQPDVLLRGGPGVEAVEERSVLRPPLPGLCYLFHGFHPHAPAGA